MKLKQRLIRILSTMLIVTVLSVQNTVPFTWETAYAAQTSGNPVATVKSITLYTGYKNYTIKLSNLSKGARITYSSNNSLVASVSAKGVIKPVKSGVAIITAAIKQDGKTFTSKIDVTVKAPYVSITNKISEIKAGTSFNFAGKAYGIDGAVLTWTSSDTSVASIGKTSGVLNAKSEGTTTVTLKDTKTGRKASVSIKVTKPAEPTKAPGADYTLPVGTDKGVYISGLDLSKETGPYYKTTEEEYIETSRFIIYLDDGIEVPVNVIDTINYIMDTIEEKTGYDFYVKPRSEYDYIMGMSYELDKYFTKAEEFKKIGGDHERVEIVAADNDQAEGAYASGASGILLAPEHIKLIDDSAAYAAVHELLHIAWQRNGEFMGSVLCEGFAEYYTDLILDHDKVLNCTYDAYENLKGYENIISEDSIEDLFLNYTEGSSRYQLGFRMTCYIMEKYGRNAYRRVHDKVTKVYDGNGIIPMDIVAKAIKSELSETFFPILQSGIRKTWNASVTGICQLSETGLLNSAL